jgi:hypothetical protein
MPQIWCKDCGSSLSQFNRGENPNITCVGCDCVLATLTLEKSTAQWVDIPTWDNVEIPTPVED